MHGGTLNLLKLKGQLAERSLNMTKLASLMGMGRDTLYHRIKNDGEKLTLGDVRKMCALLDFDEAMAVSVFFHR